jgi:secondary thiamine-phosphate synthase enzyme
MKTHTEYLTIHTEGAREIRAITEEVKAALKKSEMREGVALVGALHANAGVTLGLKDAKFLGDLDEWVRQLAPAREEYQVERGFESNASTVLQSILAGPQVSVSFSEGRLDLGPWQEVLYLEFDGQRPKRVVMKFLGE